MRTPCDKLVRGSARGGQMKFQATIVFEFSASSLVDAGHKVNDAVTHALEADEMEAKSIQVVTPPASVPVTIPPPMGA
jgi:acid stress-induced BolA-like protein IbaG/YrbA